MLNDNDVQHISGATAYGQGGDKLGKVGQVYLDDNTGQPAFVTVSTGLFGTNESFVPLEQATYDGDRLTLPYSKDQVKDAPNVDLDGEHLDPAEEERLYQHYGLTWGGTGTGTGTGTGFADTDAARTGNSAGTEGHDTSGPTTNDAMTRSEEHLDVGTTEHEAGRARLRKYVTTETETATVPVQKEHAVVEREPVTDVNAGDALDGPAISEEEHEVVLHEERAVAGTTVEPVERVRLGTETVTEQEQVSEEVRKEHIEVEGDVRDRTSD
ncbi:DUF2382 domain-containing protein [Nocardioides dongxiaopingii]|uniref:DUF2382 domain-containing protein n=1 Tax=Nocardioides sp. S-1144 TaxID=2582905 RepID=UPI0011633C18|nr:PRC and DUF2382 domain-containing protein [Nocardioides sp. S-1144]QDH10586.1 DUF2382 domain-containing protein [Nocardioides sp. S-1144]